MNIRITLITLIGVALFELIFGIWNITTQSSPDPCQLEILIDTPYWFIIKGYLLFMVTSFMYMYIGTKVETKCNLFVSSFIWLLIFAHFTWTIIGCDVFSRCIQDAGQNNHYELDRNVLWFDILLGFLLLVLHLRIMFEIHDLKARRFHYYNNDYILTYV
jgi:hypothetical protein